MNAIAPTLPIRPPSRRVFLTGLGLGAAALAGSPAALGVPARYAQRFQLSAAGTVDDFSLIWPQPDLAPLPPGTLFRIRIEFPVRRRDVLEAMTFLAPADAPDTPLFVVTLFRMRVDKIALSGTPAPNFGLFGQVIDNPVVDNPNHSPFGDLTGHVTVMCGQFDAPGDHTTFTLLGGAAAGSHASAVRTATGSLHIRGPWHAF